MILFCVSSKSHEAYRVSLICINQENKQVLKIEENDSFLPELE